MTTGTKIRRLLAAAAALCWVAALPPATAGAAVKPSPGTYQAQPVKSTGSTFQYGVFAVVSDGARRRIVSSESFAGIYFPHPADCDSYEVPLVAESIPISAKGRFSVRERTPVKRGSLLVVWDGAWKKPKRVEGTLKIKYKGCTVKTAWAGRRIATP